MTDRLPTLVTYRSATELRDAGIRYAYRRAGMHIGIVVGLVAASVAQYLAMVAGAEIGILEWMLFIFGIASIFVAGYCGRTAEFPQCPRITLEELDAMRNEMGLLPEVFRQTHDSVLHGSFEEHRAIDDTAVILERVKQASSK